MTDSQIVLLGSGTPNAEPDRSGAAVAIIVADQAYIVDFGPGIVRRSMAAYRTGVDALNPANLSIAFLTHLHSDHTVGFPDLILTPWVLEREQPLRVYGPTGTHRMAEHILSAYQADIRERLDGLEPANQTGHRVLVEEIHAGIIYQDSLISVEALNANHGAWQAFSYKFITPDRTIIISGDTAPYPGCVEAYRGCDVLIHEVYSAQRLVTRPTEWQRYHRQVHTSTIELAEIAAQSNPGLLILYHQLFWGCSEEDLLNEIRSAYDGKIISGKDLEIY